MTNDGTPIFLQFFLPTRTILLAVCTPALSTFCRTSTSCANRAWRVGLGGWMQQVMADPARSSGRQAQPA